MGFPQCSPQPSGVGFSGADFSQLQVPGEVGRGTLDVQQQEKGFSTTVTFEVLFMASSVAFI